MFGYYNRILTVDLTTRSFVIENLDDEILRRHGGGKAYKKMGTTMMVSLMNTAGAFPARYWNQGSCEHWEKISGERYHEEHEVQPHACAKCFMACGRLARLKNGRHKNLQLEGPEHETIYSFGGLCMIEEMEEVAYLNDLSDRLGMDTITVGNLCALMMVNLREGLKLADDRLPERLHRQKLPSGGELTAGEMEQMLADYYRIRGWGAEGMKPAAAW